MQVPYSVLLMSTLFVFAGYLLKMTMPKCLFKNWKLVILWDVALMMILVIEKYSLPVIDQQ